VSGAGSKRELPLEIRVYRRFVLPSNRPRPQARAHPFDRRSTQKVTSKIGFTPFLQLAGNFTSLCSYRSLKAIDSPWAQNGPEIAPANSGLLLFWLDWKYSMPHQFETNPAVKHQEILLRTSIKEKTLRTS
jgi:hypothetical protein